jgi:hypothetical protein
MLTDMTFIEDDWKIVFAAGLAYIPFNAFGQWE